MRSCSWIMVCLFSVSLGFSSVSAQESKTNAEGSTRRSLLDESSKKLVEPKRLPGNVATKSTESESANATEVANTSEKTTPKPDAPVPQTLRKVEPKKLIETAGTEGGESILLRYRFQPGMVVHSEVTHMAKNGTRIDSVQQDANSRTVTDKSWRVIGVEDGVTTFEYWIDGISMSQQVGDGEEIRYDSKEPTEEVPFQFAGAAETAGKRVSTISIDETGMVVARSDLHNPPHMGMGDVTMPLPKNPVTIGATWEIPREMKINRKDGTQRIVKFREFFKLEKISAGVAVVSVKSEPLSTMGEPSEEAQILQQLSNGTIRFDIDAGRMISKELAWDHQVVAFSGAGSVLEYSARLDDHVDHVDDANAVPHAASKIIGSGVR